MYRSTSLFLLLSGLLFVLETVTVLESAIAQNVRCERPVVNRSTLVVVVQKEVLLVLVTVLQQRRTPFHSLVAVGNQCIGLGLADGLEQTLNSQVGCIAVIDLQTV